jgi:type VI secretion system protein ImpA
MKKASLEGNWADVLEAGEKAAGLPCGRAWLDLHRYTVRACENLGSEYAAVAAAVTSGLRSLLADYPQLPTMTLMDDTPVANAETQAWIADLIKPPAAAEVADPLAEMQMDDVKPAVPEGEKAPPDVYDLAQQLVKEGKAEAAIEMLSNEVAQERSGRIRFHRMIQLAGLCMATDHERIAYPMLMELSEEIDRRKLEEWEPRNVVAQPLALLFRCMNRLGDADEEVKKRVYERICRLDPVQALACLK